jgi:hypothetical protein
MKLPVLLLFLLLTSINIQCQIQLHYCHYDQMEFDSDTCCWRQLAAKEKFIEAGNLIRDYMNCHKGKENALSLNWHAGQMFACADQYDLAKKYFRKTFSLFTKCFGGEDGLAWYYYAKGTVAFLDKDKVTLDRIIRSWNKKLPKDRNYESLIRLYSDFDSAYRIVLR